MKKAEIDYIIERSSYLQEHNRKWHFHMLGKDCNYNQHKGKFVIVLEDEETGKSYYAAFDEKPLLASKRLADLMYGAGFLDRQYKDEHNPAFDRMLHIAEKLSTQGVEWHHHHLHPTCVFNTQKGKHCIVLENPITGEVSYAVYIHKPMEDLTRIERLFYKDVN